jgi:hypothetical protein
MNQSGSLIRYTNPFYSFLVLEGQAVREGGVVIQVERVSEGS